MNFHDFKEYYKDRLSDRQFARDLEDMVGEEVAKAEVKGMNTGERNTIKRVQDRLFKALLGDI